MALNTLKCNRVTPLPFKGLILHVLLVASKCCYSYASMVSSCASWNCSV